MMLNWDSTKLEKKLKARIRDAIRKEVAIKTRTAAKAANAQRDTGNALQGEASPAPIDRRVNIVYHSQRRREVDADASHTKNFTDALVDRGILTDDSTEFIEEVRCLETEGKEDYLVIELWEA